MQHARVMSYRMPDNVVFQEVGDDIVLLNLDTGTYFGLNQTAADIYRHVLEYNSLEKLTDTLTEFEVEPDELRADARALVDELVANGLLQVVEE